MVTEVAKAKGSKKANEIFQQPHTKSQILKETTIATASKHIECLVMILTKGTRSL